LEKGFGRNDQKIPLCIRLTIGAPRTKRGGNLRVKAFPLSITGTGLGGGGETGRKQNSEGTREKGTLGH